MSRRRIEEGLVERKLAEADLLVRKYGGYAKYVEVATRNGRTEDDGGSNENWLRPIASHVLDVLSVDYPQWAGEDNISSTNDMGLKEAIYAARTDGATREGVTRDVVREIAARRVIFDPGQEGWLTKQIGRRVTQLSENFKKT